MGGVRLLVTKDHFGGGKAAIAAIEFAGLLAGIAAGAGIYLLQLAGGFLVAFL